MAAPKASVGAAVEREDALWAVCSGRGLDKPLDGEVLRYHRRYVEIRHAPGELPGQMIDCAGVGQPSISLAVDLLAAGERLAMTRPVKGLTLSRIAELPSCDVSLRELCAIVQAEDVQPSSVIKSVQQYTLVDVERAVKRYQRA